jgi:hypothetical protein
MAQPFRTRPFHAGVAVGPIRKEAKANWDRRYRKLLARGWLKRASQWESAAEDAKSFELESCAKVV